MERELKSTKKSNNSTEVLKDKLKALLTAEVDESIVRELDGLLDDRICRMV